MKVLILGMDGYLGWALYNHLAGKGYIVEGFDNYSRRNRVCLVGGNSITPIGNESRVPYGDVREWEFFENLDTDYGAVVHFAEQPSAPYSMRGVAEAVESQHNNIIGTLHLLWWLRANPHIQLIKLGSMGVYGTPDVDIPELDGPIAYDPGSFYHISKAADSINIRKACQWWDLRATDIHQGIVYGHVYDTRMDYDSEFGTAVNRFVAQAVIGYPLTIYGKGGQTRGYINIRDTLQCIEKAIEQPAEGYRVFNQLTEIFSVNDVANMVCQEMEPSIGRLKNPRFEKEHHYYNPEHSRIPALGIKPHLLRQELPSLIRTMTQYRANINPKVIAPVTTWA